MTETRRKVLLVANTSWYLYNFRRPLARALRSRGFEPVLVGPRDKYSERITAEGFQWRELPMERESGLDPFRELALLLRFRKLYRAEKPMAVHHFTIRCVIYGTLAAIATGVPYRVNAITGLGHVFIARSWKMKLLRAPLMRLYRFILGAKRSRVIFQNPDDRQAFLDLKLARPGNIFLIRGSGVDISQFAPLRAPVPGRERVTVFFAGRLIREKGLLELVEAIRKLRQAGRDYVFRIAGENDPGNPSSVSPEQIAQWKSEGIADFLGHVDPIRDELAGADIVVLPSYREGTPKILLEACAMEKPVIATDVPGCREVVVDEWNGFLVPARDSESLAQAIDRLACDPSLRTKLGKNGRAKIVEEFSDGEVASKTLAVYEDMGLFASSQA